jgi:hypothetical protein
MSFLFPHSQRPNRRNKTNPTMISQIISFGNIFKATEQFTKSNPAAKSQNFGYQTEEIKGTQFLYLKSFIFPHFLSNQTVARNQNPDFELPSKVKQKKMQKPIVSNHVSSP